MQVKNTKRNILLGLATPLIFSSIAAMISMVSCSCNKRQVERIKLISSTKDVFFTNSTQTLPLLFEVTDEHDLIGISAQVINLKESGSSIEATSDLIKIRLYSANKFSVYLNANVFHSKWPLTKSFSFDLKFINKNTNLDSLISNFTLSLTELKGKETLQKDQTFGRMVTPQFDAVSGGAYAFTCTFSQTSNKENIISDVFSMVSTGGNKNTISLININKNSNALILDTDYKIENNNSVIKLINAPAVGDEYIFEIVFSQSVKGKFVNSKIDGSSIDYNSSGLVSGFKADAQDQDINNEFATGNLQFYSFLSNINDYAFCIYKQKKGIPQEINKISFAQESTCSTIGVAAFYQSTSIEQVQLPNSLKTLSNYAFAGCYSITNINLPNSLTKLGDGCFYDNKKITEFIIPTSLETVGQGAFAYCDDLAVLDFTNWNTVPSSIKWNSLIFTSSGTSNPSTNKGKVKINNTQSKTAWKTFLDGCDLNWDHWEIEGGV